MSKALMQLQPVLSVDSETIKNWFEKDERREDVFKLFMDGRYTQEQIVEKTGVSRSSVQRWVKNPAFMARLEEEIRNFAVRRRLRRLKQTTHYTDFIGAKVELLMQEEAENIRDRKIDPDLEAVDHTGKMDKLFNNWRLLREEERKDVGEAQHTVAHHVQANVDVSQRLERPFIETLNMIFGPDGLSKDSRLAKQLEAMNPNDTANTIMGVVESALVEHDDFIDALATEDEKE